MNRVARGRTGTRAAAAADSSSRLPEGRSRLRKLFYVGFDLLNRVVPKRDLVVLHCTPGFEDGVLALSEEVLARGRQLVVLLEEPAQTSALSAIRGKDVRQVQKRSAQGMMYYLTARWIFTTHGVLGDRPSPRGQDLVNIWHGEPPTKVTARFVEGQGGIPCSFAPVCSRLGRAYRSAEFDISPLQVPVVGAPRNDRMLRADAGAVRKALLGDEAELPTLLWLPSFRAGHWRGGRTRLDVAREPEPGLPFPAADLRRIDEWLADRGARLLVKPHPHDAKGISGDYQAIRVMSPDELTKSNLTLYSILSAFDGLITDVSSVWVDYLLTGKPMVFAFPDIDDYREGRGLNLEPYEDWVPGPFVRTADELLQALEDVVGGGDPMAAERRLAQRRFHEHRDDGSSARLLDVVGIH